jgi:hypothetical protein
VSIPPGFSENITSAQPGEKHSDLFESFQGVFWPAAAIPTFTTEALGEGNCEASQRRMDRSCPHNPGHPSIVTILIQTGSSLFSLDIRLRA